jgi:hypothetical protein
MVEVKKSKDRSSPVGFEKNYQEPTLESMYKSAGQTGELPRLESHLLQLAGCGRCLEAATVGDWNLAG